MPSTTSITTRVIRAAQAAGSAARPEAGCPGSGFEDFTSIGPGSRFIVTPQAAPPGKRNARSPGSSGNTQGDEAVAGRRQHPAADVAALFRGALGGALHLLAQPRGADCTPPADARKGYLGVELFFIRPALCCATSIGPLSARGGSGDGVLRCGTGWRGSIRCIWPLCWETGRPWRRGRHARPASPADANMMRWGPARRTCCRFTPGASARPGFNHPSWSISAEWFAYLTFPAFRLASPGSPERPPAAVSRGLAWRRLRFLHPARFSSALSGFPLTRGDHLLGAAPDRPLLPARRPRMHGLWKSGRGEGPPQSGPSWAPLFQAARSPPSDRSAGRAGYGRPWPRLRMVILALVALPSTGSQAFANRDLRVPWRDQSFGGHGSAVRHERIVST